MSRQEDFIEAGIEYRFKQGKPMAIGGDNFAEMAKELNRVKPFEAGAEHGYQYAVDKACEWLADRVAHDSIDYPMATVHLIDDFRKAMQ